MQVHFFRLTQSRLWFHSLFFQPLLFSLLFSANYDYSEYDDDYYNGVGSPNNIDEPIDYEPGYGSNCRFEDRVYADGESFEPEACTRCTCFQGSVSCERDLCGDNTCAGVLCPEVDCENKYIPLGQCCPVCPGG